MAVSLVRDCPHCGAAGMAFNYLSQRPTTSGRELVIAFTCNRCSEGYFVTIETGGSDSSSLSSGAGDFDARVRANHWRVMREYPKKKAVVAPEHISHNVNRCFLQAGEAAHRGHHDAAGAMYRKAIDLATKELDPALAGKNLAPRIEALYQAGKLTTDLKEWAHRVRLDGNEAAHEDEELTGEDIKHLGSFAELFLIYTFTLPGRIRTASENESPP